MKIKLSLINLLMAVTIVMAPVAVLAEEPAKALSQWQLRLHLHQHQPLRLPPRPLKLLHRPLPPLPRLLRLNRSIRCSIPATPPGC